jgi:uncharacterized protein
MGGVDAEDQFFRNSRLGGEPTLLGVGFFEKVVALRRRYARPGQRIEHDGSVYACDHYVYPEYRLGNVRARSLGNMVFDPAQVRFAYAKSESLPAHYRECRFLRDCWGECPKNRFVLAPDGEPGLNYLCPGLKRFIAHAAPEAERMAARLRAGPLWARPRMPA